MIFKLFIDFLNLSHLLLKRMTRSKYTTILVYFPPNITMN